jgi:hypothetical protein
MNRIPKLKPGDLLEIPFKDSMHTYGRILIEGSCAIYDCPSTSNLDPYKVIADSDILFVAQIDAFVFVDTKWKLIGNIPLEGNLKNYYPRYFNPNPTSPESLNFYEVYKDEIDNAIQNDWIKTGKTQLGGIHGAIHLVGRILDYYGGRRNEFNVANISLFMKMRGLPN